MSPVQVTRVMGCGVFLEAQGVQTSNAFSEIIVELHAHKLNSLSIPSIRLYLGMHNCVRNLALYSGVRDLQISKLNMIGHQHCFMSIDVHPILLKPIHNEVHSILIPGLPSST
jgi:hypothetical protein